MNKDDFCKTQLSPGGIIVVGISGGPDSVALLHYLHINQFPLIAAIFNHKLRKEADDDVQFVKTLANSMGIPFVTDHFDVQKYAKENVLSIEEAARILRYTFLFSQAKIHHAQAVAVGHTSDDQAETILMHLIKGAGLYGLKGMLPRIINTQFDESIPLVRPLLTWTRQDTELYCQNAGIVPIIDQTNFDSHYFRNKLRHEIIPVLEQCNPKLKNTLNKTAEVLQGELEIIEAVVNDHWKKAVIQIKCDYIDFDYQYLMNLTIPIRRHILRKAIITLDPVFPGIDFDELEKASQLKIGFLSGGFRIEIEGNTLSLLTKGSEINNEIYPQFSGVMEINPGINELDNNWYLEKTITSPYFIKESYLSNKEPFTIFIDANKISGKLLIRNIKNGDRINLFGLDGHSRKLSDIFVDKKIPKKYRPSWPVLCDDNKIIWLAGLRESDIYKITTNTIEIIQIKIRKKVNT